MAEFCERSIWRGRGAWVLSPILLMLTAGACAPKGPPGPVVAVPPAPIALDLPPPERQVSARSALRFEDSGYAKCAPCHAHEYPINGIGPHLVDLYGRKIGSVENFRYSEALGSVGGTWDAATLDRFLADPEGFAPGTKMVFRGIESAEARGKIVAYLLSEAREEGADDAK